MVLKETKYFKRNPIERLTIDQFDPNTVPPELQKSQPTTPCTERKVSAPGSVLPGLIKTDSLFRQPAQPERKTPGQQCTDRGFSAVTEGSETPEITPAHRLPLHRRRCRLPGQYHRPLPPRCRRSHPALLPRPARPHVAGPRHFHLQRCGSG